MKRIRTIDPIAYRQNQIDREVQRIFASNNKKTRRDFKSDEAFEAWKNRQQLKLDQLAEERTILAYREGYEEVPLAIVAFETGATLSEILEIVAEDLVAISFEAEYIQPAVE